MDPAAPPGPHDRPLFAVTLPTDLALGSVPVYAHALAIALHNHARLHLVHVHPASAPEVAWSQLPSVRDLLVRWGRLGPEDGPDALQALRVHVHLEDVKGPDPARGAAQELTRLHPDLVVLGTHRRKGLAHLVQGSVAERIFRKTWLPTLFLGLQDPGWVDLQTGAQTLRRVVLPCGQDVQPADLLGMAGAWLPRLGPGPFDITIVHAGAAFDRPPPPLPAGLDASVRQVAHATGDVVAAVLAEIELMRADLVVMATHGHDSWLDDLAGSKTEQLVRWCNAPVLVLPVARG